MINSEGHQNKVIRNGGTRQRWKKQWRHERMKKRKSLCVAV